MIRIRYNDISAGTHDVTWWQGRAEYRPRGATVYFVPGLTAGQRRAVLRRLRQEASRGFGPALPRPQLAVALGADRVRAAVRTAGAVVRLHPAVTLIPGALAVVSVALLVLASAGAGGPGGSARPRNQPAQAAWYAPAARTLTVDGPLPGPPGLGRVERGIRLGQHGG